MVHVTGTEPYAWPYDGRVGGDHLALVVAGWDTGWQARVTAPPAHVDQLAEAVAGAGGLVVTVAHGPGAEAIPLAAPHESVSAAGVDGFFGSALDTVLRAGGRTHLLVVGNGIEAAVHSTLRSANDRGYECLLVTDACAALTDHLPAASAKTVTMSGGIFGAIGSTAAVLDALASEHPAPVTAQEGLS